MALSLDILDRNLAALQVRQPEVAALIKSCALPQGLVPVLGRDGTPTFQMPGEKGPVWLGGSSTPRAGAEEMFGSVDPRGGSATLPAMLTGMEAIVLAERLAPRFAVFIVDEPTAFKTALCLRSYEAYFKAGRIIVLLSDDLPARARQFFSRNPGFAMPAHLFKVPQLAAGQLANLARSLEDAGAQAMTVQTEIVTTLVQRLRNANTGVLPAAPRIAILSADDSGATVELAGRLGRAFNAFAADCNTCLPINPQQCHIAARIATVEQTQADLVLSINGISGHERSLFPPELPMVDWLSHGAPLRHRSPGGPFDFTVTESRSGQEQACSIGWPRDRVLLLEPAADIVNDENAGETTSVDEESPVAVIMDLPDDRPEAAGVALPSHLALWKAMQQEVLRRCDRYTSNDAGAVLGAAQKSCGTVLTDAALSTSFEGWLRSHIAPATVARSLALSLVKNGFQPEIWGRNWPALGRGVDLRRGVIPTGIDLHRVLERPAWVVFPWFSHGGVQLALDAMARGSVVIMRGTGESFAAEYPGLAEAIYWFNTAAELVSTLRGLISRHERAAEDARIFARRIRTEHTVVNRLQSLVQHVRALQRIDAKGSS